MELIQKHSGNEILIDYLIDLKNYLIVLKQWYYNSKKPLGNLNGLLNILKVKSICSFL